MGVAQDCGAVQVIGFLTSRWGIAAIAAVAVLFTLTWLYIDIKAAGAAAAMAAAAAEAARRAKAAREARSQVDHSKGAVDADPFNRDNR